MAKTSTEIKFEIADVTARADSTPTATDKQTFVDLTDLKLDEIDPIKVATLENDYWLLDGTFAIMPDDPTAHEWGLWSQGMTGADGTFSAAPVLTIDFSENHSSLGITLSFFGDSYADSISITWYDSGGNPLTEATYFTPDKMEYFCECQVLNYQKVVISFLSMSKPYRYLKLAAITYGAIKTFANDEIINAKITEEVNPISAEISINTLNFRVYSSDAKFSIINPTGMYSVLQQRQPLTVYETIDGLKTMMGVYYLEEWENGTENSTNMTAIDLIGVVDKTEFTGGLYTNKNVAELIGEIMTSAGAEYELDSSYESEVLTGKIGVCTHREALQQVAFAIGAIVDCSRSDKIRIYPPPTVASSNIDKDHKLQGQNLILKTLVTGVEVTTHSYSPDGQTDTTGIVGVYATDLPSGVKPNVITVKDATLVSSANGLAVAQRIYDYYQRRYKNEVSLIMQSEKAGAEVTVDSMYDQQIQGMIESITIDLSGGFIGDAVIVGDVVST